MMIAKNKLLNDPHVSSIGERAEIQVSRCRMKSTSRLCIGPR